MSFLDISTIELCPINFKKFGDLNRIIKNIEETLLLSKIKFHLKNTRLKKSGRPSIARTRKEIKNWFRFSERKTDALLSSLCKKGFLQKAAGTFYGKKKLFLSVSEDIKELKINSIAAVKIGLMDVQYSMALKINRNEINNSIT